MAKHKFEVGDIAVVVSGYVPDYSPNSKKREHFYKTGTLVEVRRIYFGGSLDCEARALDCCGQDISAKNLEFLGSTTK